jgi:hypothetical protein
MPKRRTTRYGDPFLNEIHAMKEAVFAAMETTSERS